MTLMAESEEELKSLLMKVKEESEKAGLKCNVKKKKKKKKKPKIMESGPITLWQIERESSDKFYIFLDFKITVDGDCSLKLKDTCFFKGRLRPT